MKRFLLIGILAAVVGVTTQAMQPPDLMNYQGVLRDSSGGPLDGTHGMVFRFFSAETGGEEVLVDTHAAVTVSGGLFNVQLGKGSVSDGSGSGVYDSLAQVFRDHPDVYLQVEVTGEVLDPRIRVMSSAYAHNTHYVKGQDLISDGPLALYVDDVTGDDANDGLDSAKAKKTIQAAVDAIPSVLKGEVIVRVQPGVYNERVLLPMRTRIGGLHWVRLIGDPDGYPNPTVTVDGTNLPEPGPAESDDAITVFDLPVEIVGFKVANFQNGAGPTAAFGSVVMVRNCISENNEYGLLATAGGHIEVENSGFSGNYTGIVSENGSFVEAGPGTSTENNTSHGASAQFASFITFQTPCTITNNDVEAKYHSTVFNWSGCTLTNSTCLGDCDPAP